MHPTGYHPDLGTTTESRAEFSLNLAWFSLLPAGAGSIFVRTFTRKRQHNEAWQTEQALRGALREGISFRRSFP